MGRLVSGNLDTRSTLPRGLGSNINPPLVDAGVADCRSARWMASWAEVGKATNMSRQAAQERWASLGGERRAGGQPSSLR